MIPSHASLPLVDLSRVMACPWCGRVDPRCGERIRYGANIDVEVCAIAPRDGIVIQKKKWREWDVTQ